VRLPAFLVVSLLVVALGAIDARPLAAQSSPSYDELDRANPVAPLPGRLLGLDMALSDLKSPPTPEQVRLGRWLYFDKRLSADGTISCATCHIPEHGFSEPTPVSTGLDGQKGGRKAPSFINAAFAFYPETFWDGRAGSLEEQAAGPMANPIEMGNTHEVVVRTVAGIEGYRPFFKEAFGNQSVDLDRITKAIAAYERTRISGNSPWDRWRDADGDDPEAERLVSDAVKRGHELFFGDAKCATCHVGTSFTDSKFHNLGIGYDPYTGEFVDVGRYAVTGKDEDMGAFKTPGLREVSRRAPYMHDGSLATLKDVVEHYRVGGTPNPHLSPKMFPLELSEADVDALVAFMEALEGEGFMDSEPELFPQ
jgi:cytochrome c peroxidase